MKLEWTEQALESFLNIKSLYFTMHETKVYKKRLLRMIEDKISLLGRSVPVGQSEWEGTYKIIVDKFIVYYSFSESKEVCYIEYFKHSSQRYTDS